MNNNEQHLQIANMSDEYKKQLVKYFFQCILSEASKILLFSIIFIRLHLFKEFLFALVLLIFLRTNGGGLHFKHYCSCFIVSFFVLFGSIVLALKLPFTNLTAGITLLICIILGYLYVPIVSSNRPPASEQLIKKSKRSTTLILSVYFLLICIVPINQYLSTGVWIIIIHICQLLLAKFLKRRSR